MRHRDINGKKRNAKRKKYRLNKIGRKDSSTIAAEKWDRNSCQQRQTVFFHPRIFFVLFVVWLAFTQSRRIEAENVRCLSFLVLLQQDKDNAD